VQEAGERERVVWQAAPAPRGYVFRHWRSALVCLPVWLGLSFRFLWVFRYGPGPVLNIPWLAVWFVAGYGSVGRCVMARMSWRYQRYWLTDRGLFARCGFLGKRLNYIAIGDVVVHKVLPLSGSVATVQARSRVDGSRVTMHCLEGADMFLRSLENLSVFNG
jgi:hypothetical protein